MKIRASVVLLVLAATGMLLTGCSTGSDLSQNEMSMLRAAYEKHATFNFRGETIYCPYQVDQVLPETRTVTFPSNSLAGDEKVRGLPWGEVELGMILDSTGTPRYVIPLEVNGHRPGDLTKGVMSVVKTMNFTPALRNNKPVHSILVANFTVPKNDDYPD